MQGRSVKPWQTSVDEECVHIRIHVHQVQRLCHDLDLGPLHQSVQRGAQVCAVVQDAKVPLFGGWLGALRVQALLGAIVVQGCGQDASVPAVRDKGLEHTALDHALHGTYRQAQHFRGLTGADIGLGVLRCFHG